MPLTNEFSHTKWSEREALLSPVANTNTQEEQKSLLRTLAQMVLLFIN